MPVKIWGATRERPCGCTDRDLFGARAHTNTGTSRTTNVNTNHSRSYRHPTTGWEQKGLGQSYVSGDDWRLAKYLRKRSAPMSDTKAAQLIHMGAPFLEGAILAGFKETPKGQLPYLHTSGRKRGSAPGVLFYANLQGI